MKRVSNGGGGPKAHPTFFLDLRGNGLDIKGEPLHPKPHKIFTLGGPSFFSSKPQARFFEEYPCAKLRAPTTPTRGSAPTTVTSSQKCHLNALWAFGPQCGRRAQARPAFGAYSWPLRCAGAQTSTMRSVLSGLVLAHKCAPRRQRHASATHLLRASPALGDPESFALVQRA